MANSSVILDGVDQILAFGVDGVSLGLSYPITIAGWFNPDSAATNKFLAALSQQGGANSDRQALQVNAGTLTANEIANFNAGSATKAGVTPASAWYSLIVSFINAASRKAWVNGGTAGTNTTNVTAYPTIDTFAVGGRFENGAPDLFWAGKAAHLSVHTAAFTDTDAANHAAGRRANLLPSPTHWWKFDGSLSDSIGVWHLTKSGTAALAYSSSAAPVQSDSFNTRSPGLPPGRSDGQAPYDVGNMRRRRRR